MVQHSTALSEQLVALTKEGLVVLGSNVFHHADRNDTVELTSQVTIILLDKVDLQSG